MNWIASHEMTETKQRDRMRELQERQLVEQLRIDRPQRGSLRLMRRDRGSLYIVRLERP